MSDSEEEFIMDTPSSSSMKFSTSSSDKHSGLNLSISPFIDSRSTISSSITSFEIQFNDKLGNLENSEEQEDTDNSIQNFIEACRSPPPFDCTKQQMSYYIKELENILI